MSYYQARNIRQEVAQATVVQLELARTGAAPAAVIGHDTAITSYKTIAAEQAKRGRAQGAGRSRPEAL